MKCPCCERDLPAPDLPSNLFDIDNAGILRAPLDELISAYPFGCPRVFLEIKGVDNMTLKKRLESHLKPYGWKILIANPGHGSQWRLHKFLMEGQG